jgi:hypothetical protein
LWAVNREEVSKIGSMLNKTTEMTLSNILMLGSAFITVFIMTGSVTDPVNVTKFLALGGVGGAGLAIAISFGARNLWNGFKVPIISLILFMLTIVNSIMQSPAPFNQLIYGTFGRNTGAITYLFLIALFVAGLSLSHQSSFPKISYGLLAAGLINVLYCLWVITFGDFLGWTNPYGNILGTFGNPNFIGSFLGIFASITFAFLIKPNLAWAYRGISLLILIITMVEINASNAVQGIVVSAGGISLVGFFYIRSRVNSKSVLAIYSGSVLFAGSIAGLGALQIGPLASLVYKNSVSLRGEYWQAAWNMGEKFPLHGVGMDSYGDWYRLLRDDQALINPGPSTVTNAAHNVVLDQFAYGGWPMLLAYLAILILVGIAIVRVSLRNKEFNFTFVGLSVAWICYQVQSLISINQIGLATWGWLLGGVLIAYERSTRLVGSEKSNDLDPKPSKKARNRQSVGLSPFMVGAIGAVVGLLITSPPINSDIKWQSALRSGDVSKVEATLIPSYLNPQSSNRYATVVQLLEANKFYDLAYKYAKIGVAFNSNSFDAWRLMYFIQNSTPAEKELARKNLLRLDPKNKTIFDISK